MVLEVFTSSQCESGYPPQVITTESSQWRNTGNSIIVSSPHIDSGRRELCSSLPQGNALLDNAFCITLALWHTPTPSWQPVLGIKTWSTFKLFKATTCQSRLKTHTEQNWVTLHLHCLPGSSGGSRLPFEHCLCFLSEGALWLDPDRNQKQTNVYVAGQRKDRSPRAKQRIIQADRLFAPSAAASVPVEYLTLCWTNPAEEKLNLDSTRCPCEKGRPGFQFFFRWQRESFLSYP